MIPDLDKKIFAYALVEKRILMDLQSTTPPDYIHALAQPFYKAILSCFDKYREVPTLSIIQENSPDDFSDFKQLYEECLQLEIDVREFPADLEKLRIRYNEQVLLQFGKTIFNQNWNGKTFENLEEANVALKRLSTSIDSIYKRKIFREGSLADTASEAKVRYKQIKENPGVARGIHVGLREFDRITNGLQPSELLLIGGESSAGKSALAMNMAINAWLGSNRKFDILDMPSELHQDGCNVLYFSIEMPYEPMRRRCDACLAGVSLYGIRDGTLTPNEEIRFFSALDFQERYNKHFHILDIPRGCTMAMIESKFIEKCYEYQPDLIVVDYISLMTPDIEQGSDWLNLGRTAEQLHEFCRTYRVAVISPVQLNRPERGKKADFDAPAPDQHRVGRSIMLTQNANILINIETRKDEELKPDMSVKIAKMRDGERGAFILNKRLDIMRIYDDVPGWTPEVYNED